ncbi:MAG TPA: polysaccharide deacetylase family protein [Stellaceae bacterium]|nr:polysaccharide deacetylase family protein [Stellaceae bacterium]
MQRDFVGYGNSPPQANWPGKARLALNFNLNYEAGGERGVLEGDESSEDMLNDIGMGAQAGVRNPLVESVFEYGSRVGVWRLLRIFKRFEVRVSILGVVRALQRNPQAVAAFLEAGHEIVSHGWRWIDYHHVDPATEREHIRLAVEAISDITGAATIGWMTGRPGPNTRQLLAETGRIHYDRDYLGDELPFWTSIAGKSHLVIPYSYETNDNRFNENRGFSTADDFARYMIDCFDLLYEEGADCPRLMSVGLHDRLIGRPGRAPGLIRFLEHVRNHDRVWICTGREIADHWRRVHPPRP